MLEEQRDQGKRKHGLEQAAWKVDLRWAALRLFVSPGAKVLEQESLSMRSNLLSHCWAQVFRRHREQRQGN